MLFEYNPVPKPTFEKKKKETPPPWKKAKQKEKRPSKSKLPISAERMGDKPPSRSARNEFSAAARKRIQKEFGAICNDPRCGRPAIDMHHVVYRSQSGRGVWRNGIPLCDIHHDRAHKEKAYRLMLIELRIVLFGPHFFKDKWDLWYEGLIADPTNEALEKFMIDQGGKEIGKSATKEIFGREG